MGFDSLDTGKQSMFMEGTNDMQNNYMKCLKETIGDLWL